MKVRIRKVGPKLWEARHPIGFTSRHITPQLAYTWLKIKWFDHYRYYGSF